MIGDISKAEHIYIAVGYTDMRKQIDGLSAIVQQNFKLDPFSNSVFLFFHLLLGYEDKALVGEFVFFPVSAEYGCQRWASRERNPGVQGNGVYNASSFAGCIWNDVCRDVFLF